MRLVRAAKAQAAFPAIEVMVSTGLIRDYIINEEKTYLIREAIANGTSQYAMQTFDQALFSTIPGAENQFGRGRSQCPRTRTSSRCAFSGILSTEQAIDAEGRVAPPVESPRDQFESLIVKL